MADFEFLPYFVLQLIFKIIFFLPKYSNLLFKSVFINIYEILKILIIKINIFVECRIQRKTKQQRKIIKIRITIIIIKIITKIIKVMKITKIMKIKKSNEELFETKTNLKMENSKQKFLFFRSIQPQYLLQGQN